MIVIRNIAAIFYPDWSFSENYISDSFLYHNIWIVDLYTYLVIINKALKI